MSEKALIIVDMLNDFLDEKGTLYCGKEAQAIVPFIQERLKEYRYLNEFVIYLQDSHDENDREFERFPKHCVSGSRGSEIIPELAPLPNEKIIPKKRFSGFYGTDLENVLASAGVNAVEVVGVCTSICVMDTVGGLANRDYKISVPIRGVADFDPEFHEFALKRMKQLYGAEVS
ncbi:cysteine hydrolase family protein [Desulfonema magnum]|uniref:Isochorismatase family protein n=1 Tax=Desulfonema magnum TaxID=45655 RepID=A0A975BS54_9BACT|nr:isochorismatase family cysteine hydrolase [Desulfonema magnum]QTA90219.1 Isochorismatase family protein [Desulfonema magnum]